VPLDRGVGNTAQAIREVRRCSTCRATHCLLLAHLYSDTASGKQDDRPGLAACLQALREGDKLVVWKLDRLDAAFDTS